MADATYTPKVYRKNGGDELVIASGGTLTLESGAIVGGSSLVKVKNIAVSIPTGAEQDSTWDLPTKSVVLDIFIDVTTAEATGTTKTLDVGLLSSESGGDLDGFIDGVSVASTGIKRGGFVFTTDHYDTFTRGVLMAKAVQGAGTDDRGLYSEFPHLSTSVTAKSVVYKAGSNDFAEFVGVIYIIYMEI